MYVYCCVCVSVQFSSVTLSYLTLFYPMDCSLPGLPVHNQLPEFTQTCPLSWWCHPTISSSVIPFSSCLQSFPASGSFQLSQFFASGGQSIEVSTSTLVLPMNNQDWSTRMDWLDLLALQVTLKSLLQHQVQNRQFFGTQLSLESKLTPIHDYWKNHSFD